MYVTKRPKALPTLKATVHTACQNPEIRTGLFFIQYDLDTLSILLFNKEERYPDFRLDSQGCAKRYSGKSSGSPLLIAYFRGAVCRDPVDSVSTDY